MNKQKENEQKKDMSSQAPPRQAFRRLLYFLLVLFLIGASVWVFFRETVMETFEMMEIMWNIMLEPPDPGLQGDVTIREPFIDAPHIKEHTRDFPGRAE